eukprot:272197_1
MASESGMLSRISKFLYCKETLLWTPLLVDVLLAAGTYPFFFSQGLEVMKTMGATDAEVKKMKSDDNARALFELQMVTYTGYCTLLFSSTYCCYYYPLCRKATGWALFALIIAKKLAFTKFKVLNTNEEIRKMQEEKDASLTYFNIPFYGGYCLINLYHWYQSLTK